MDNLLKERSNLKYQFKKGPELIVQKRTCSEEYVHKLDWFGFQFQLTDVIRS